MCGRLEEVVAGLFIGVMFFAFFMVGVDAVEVEAQQGVVPYAVYVGGN